MNCELTYFKGKAPTHLHTQKQLIITNKFLFQIQPKEDQVHPFEYVVCV